MQMQWSFKTLLSELWLCLVRVLALGAEGRWYWDSSQQVLIWLGIDMYM